MNLTGHLACEILATFQMILWLSCGLFKQEQAGYYGLLESRLPKPSKRRGITFAELEQFFALLNNISDFALAFRRVDLGSVYNLKQE